MQPVGTAAKFPVPSPSNDGRSSPRSLRGLRMRKYFSLVLLIVLASATIPHAHSQHQDDLIDPDPQPRWFKGNLHTHSLWSDGNDYPEMIVDWYARHGYHFLALSDHNILSQGQKWMSVMQANQRAGEDGFGRYRKRFGDVLGGDTNGQRRPARAAQALERVPVSVRAGGEFPADPGGGDHRPFRGQAHPHECQQPAGVDQAPGGQERRRDDGQQPRRRRGTEPKIWGDRS